eukprot:1153136-Pelagomonas_calceolata.AAC.1
MLACGSDGAHAWMPGGSFGTEVVLGVGAVEMVFGGGVTQHGSAYLRAHLPILNGSQREEGGPFWDVGEHA